MKNSQLVAIVLKDQQQVKIFTVFGKELYSFDKLIVNENGKKDKIIEVFSPQYDDDVFCVLTENGVLHVISYTILDS